MRATISWSKPRVRPCALLRQQSRHQGLIRAAAIEAAPFGITVNGVEPGNILSEGMQAERSADYIDMMAGSVPLGRLGTPEDVGNAVLFLASDEAGYITGTTIVVDGGQILPEAKS